MAISHTVNEDRLAFASFAEEINAYCRELLTPTEN